MQFFPLNERLSLLMALIMGLQHAMVIMVGLMFAPVAVAALAPPGSTIPQCTCAIIRIFICLNTPYPPDLVSACFIVTGIATLIQVYSVPIWPKKGIRLGSGLLSMMGCTVRRVYIKMQHDPYCVNTGHICRYHCTHHPAANAGRVHKKEYTVGARIIIFTHCTIKTPTP